MQWIQEAYFCGSSYSSKLEQVFSGDNLYVLTVSVG